MSWLVLPCRRFLPPLEVRFSLPLVTSGVCGRFDTPCSSTNIVALPEPDSLSERSKFIGSAAVDGSAAWCWSSSLSAEISAAQHIHKRRSPSPHTFNAAFCINTWALADAMSPSLPWIGLCERSAHATSLSFLERAYHRRQLRRHHLQISIREASSCLVALQAQIA